MPSKEDKLTKYLVIVLIVITLITISLLVIYSYSTKSDASNPKAANSIVGNITRIFTPNKTVGLNSNKITPKPVETQTYTGFVQEIAKKSREIDGVKYTHVIGLLDKSGNSLPVWMNEAEFNSIKYFNNINGEHVAITENDIKGGQLLRVTRTKTLNNGINESIITVELI